MSSAMENSLLGESLQWETFALQLLLEMGVTADIAIIDGMTSVLNLTKVDLNEVRYIA